MTTIGPTLPPELLSKRKRSATPDAGTALPPAKRSRSTSPTSPPGVIGPFLPPAPLSERPTTDPAASDSDSDSDIGPSLPSGNQSALTSTTGEHHTPSPPPPSKPQREEWMLLPPSSSDWTSRVDPTKLRARKFNTGKSARDPNRGSGVDRTWTETPEQKRQRLEDEVLGKSSAPGAEPMRGGPVAGDKESEARRRKEQKERRETERKIREYNEERGRGGSLYDEHTKRREKRTAIGKGEMGGKDEEDDPSKRAFDREKDMALGAKLGYKARSDMTRNAKDFGGRFGAGGYL